MSSPNDAPPWRLEWNDALSVCIPEIDAEHRHFILLVNKLNEAIIGRMAMEVIKTRLQAILDDTAAHFAHEEVLLREWGYPETAEHAHKHAQIMLALREIMGRFRLDGGEYELIEAGLKIKQVLIDHILSADMMYRDYCSRNHLNNDGC